MTIEYMSIEEASFRAVVWDAVADAAAHGRTLESIGRSLDEAVCGVTSDADADELGDVTARVEGAVVHAQAVVAALATSAGRLGALAALRGAACPKE